MSIRLHLLSFLLLSLLFLQAQSQTAPISISHNEKYMYTTSVSMSSTHISQSLSGTQEISLYHVPYPESLSNATFTEVILSIDGISLSMQQNKSVLLILQDVKESFFELGIITTILQTLQRLSVRYLILSGNYSSANAANMKAGLGIVGLFSAINSSMTNITGTLNYAIPINTTTGLNNIKTICFMAGYSLNSTTSQKILDVHVHIATFNSTQLVFHIFTESTVNVYV